MMRGFAVSMVCAACVGIASPAVARDANPSMATCATHDVSVAAADRITACTTIIQSGKLTGAVLGQAYAFRGMGYKINRDFAHAIADFGQAISIDPTSSFAYLARASAYLQDGDVPAAIADLSELIRRDPKDAVAYYLRGAAEARIGEMAESKADVSRALAIDPDVEKHFK
jgi:tetratricopeptide (TPR) repeat protein